MNDAGSARRYQRAWASHRDTTSHGSERASSFTISPELRQVRSFHSTERTRASRRISGCMIAAVYETGAERSRFLLYSIHFHDAPPKGHAIAVKVAREGAGRARGDVHRLRTVRGPSAGLAILS